MNKGKFRRFILCLVLAAVPAMTAVLAACGGEVYHTSFYDGETILAEFEGGEGAAFSYLPSPKEGYDFAGWSVSADGSEMWDGSKADGMKFYATWKIKSFTVVFYDFDGAELSTQTVEYLKDAEAPTVPTHEGRIFKKWSRAFNAVKSDLEVTALYDNLSYTLTIIEDGAAREQPVEFGTPLSSLGFTAPEGLSVDGLESGGNDVTDATMPAEDFAVTVRYEIDTQYFENSIKFTQGASAVYGGAPVSLGVTHAMPEGFTFNYDWSQGEDSLFVSGTPTISTSAAAAGVFDYCVRVTCRRGDLTAVASGEIEVSAAKASLKINIEDAEVVYGDAVPKFVFTAAEGLVGGDVVEDCLRGELDGGYGAEGDSDVGEYAISLGTLTSDNYEISINEGGVLTVSPRPLTLSLTAAHVGTGWSASPASTAFDGLLVGHTAAANIACGKASGTYSNPADFTVDGFVVTGGGVDVTENYALTLNVTLKLTAAPPSYIAEDVSCIYDGLGHGAAVSPLGTAQVKYSVDGGEYNLDQSPTFVRCGEHSVYYRVTDDGASVDGVARVRITPAAAQLTSEKIFEFDWSTSVTEEFIKAALQEGTRFTGAPEGEAGTISVNLSKVAFDKNGVASGGTYPAVISASGGDFIAQSTSVYIKIKTVLFGETLYTPEDALMNAAAGTLVVIADTRFADVGVARELYADARYYAVKKGVTLLLPFDDKYSDSTINYSDAQSVAVRAPYVTLTVPASVKLKVYGIMTVNAKRGRIDTRAMGTVCDNSVLNTEKNAELRVMAGGKLNAIGFIIGEGTVSAQRGASVYETTTLLGFRGGTVSFATYRTIMPFNQWKIDNIEARFRIEDGAVLRGKVFIYAGYAPVFVDIPLFGDTDDYLVQVGNGYIEKCADVARGRTVVDIYGDAEFNTMSIKIAFYTMTTKGKDMPFSGNFDLCVHSGTTTVNGHSLKFLPGASLTIEKGAVLKIAGGGKLFVYNDKDFGWIYDGGDPRFPYFGEQALSAYRVRPNLGFTISSEAIVTIKGALIVEGASIAGRIDGGEGGKIKLVGATTQASIKEYKIQGDGIPTEYLTMSGSLALDGVASPQSNAVYAYAAGGWA